MLAIFSGLNIGLFDAYLAKKRNNAQFQNKTLYQSKTRQIWGIW